MKSGKIIEIRINNNGTLISNDQKIDFSPSGLTPGYMPKVGDQVAFEVKDQRAIAVRLLQPDETFADEPVAVEIHPAETPAGPELDRFLNPYNFVRFISQARQKGHVLGDAPPPPHDRYVGLSGRIDCTLEAVSPLFISDSHGVVKTTVNGKEHFTYRFFQVENGPGKLEPAIPASSLRGMLRSTFEAVTNSCFSVFDPSGFDFRRGNLPEGIVPARVVEINNGEAKLEILDCSTGSLPNGVQGHKSHNQFTRIMKTASVVAYSPRVWKKNNQGQVQVFNPANSVLPTNLKDGDRIAALIDLNLKPKIVHDQVRYQYFRASKVVPVSQHNTLLPTNTQVKIFGYIHITGPNIENKHDERIFFRWDDLTPEKPIWSTIRKRQAVKAKTIEEYEHHLALYWDRNKLQIDRLGERPWQASPSNIPHPSYFIGKKAKLCQDDLVYFIPNSQLGIPILRPILITRLPYKYDRGQLLGQFDHLNRCKDYSNLCPACRTFGWVYMDKQDETVDPLKKVAYAGRVRLSHAKLTKDAGCLNDITLSILSSPKPTTTQFYLLNPDGEPDPKVDYNTDKARLRGRKVYRHFGSWSKMSEQEKQVRMEEIRQKTDNGEQAESDQNRTIRGALNPGAQFKFQVEFENLMPLELGALLFSLQLEDGMVQRLGYAKPLGFGSVRLSIEHLKILNWQERLKSLEIDAGWQDWDGQRSKLIEDFLIYMQGQYKTEFQDVLDDLKALLSEPPTVGQPPRHARIHYPRPQKDPHPDGKQFEWFVGNKKQENPITLSLASMERENPNEWLPRIDKEGHILKD